LFRRKAIAALATVACVFAAQQGSAGNAEFLLARPTLMVLPLAAIAPVAVAASANAQGAVFDYQSPARQIVFPGLEEQIVENTFSVRIPIPTFRPDRAKIRANREIRPSKPRQLAQAVRVRSESRRVLAISAVRFSGTMQPIIGAFR
jgi:hypothetical protein